MIFSKLNFSMITFNTFTQQVLVEVWQVSINLYHILSQETFLLSPNTKVNTTLRLVSVCP